MVFQDGQPGQESVGVLALTPSGNLAWAARLLSGWFVSLSAAGSGVEVVAGFSGLGFWLAGGTVTRFDGAAGTGLVVGLDQDGVLETASQFSASPNHFDGAAADGVGGAVVSGPAFAVWGVEGDLVDTSPSSGVAVTVMRLTEPDAQACEP